MHVGNLYAEKSHAVLLSSGQRNECLWSEHIYQTALMHRGIIWLEQSPSVTSFLWKHSTTKDLPIVAVPREQRVVSLYLEKSMYIQLSVLSTEYSLVRRFWKQFVGLYGFIYLFFCYLPLNVYLCTHHKFSNITFFKATERGNMCHPMFNRTEKSAYIVTKYCSTLGGLYRRHCVIVGQDELITKDVNVIITRAILQLQIATWQRNLHNDIVGRSLSPPSSVPRLLQHFFRRHSSPPIPEEVIFKT